MLTTIAWFVLGIIGLYAVIAGIVYVYLRNLKDKDRLPARKQAAKWGVTVFKAIKAKFKRS